MYSDSDDSLIADPPRSSLFSRLPLELVARIVELVQHQDEAMRNSEIHIGEPLKRPPRGVSWADAKLDSSRAVDITRGYWPTEYGKGVLRLSRVNKALRALCIPYIMKTVTVRQLSRPTFQTAILANTPLLALVKEVKTAVTTVHIDSAQSVSDIICPAPSPGSCLASAGTGSNAARKRDKAGRGAASVDLRALLRKASSVTVVMPFILRDPPTLLVDGTLSPKLQHLRLDDHASLSLSA
ncbi:hypothetical protein JCM8547_006310 [Rhodosporidiobolus lusitaniae]